MDYILYIYIYILALFRDSMNINYGYGIYRYISFIAKSSPGKLAVAMSRKGLWADNRNDKRPLLGGGGMGIGVANCGRDKRGICQ